MGMGKTSAMINMINESKNDDRFLYITPYLSEVNRIIKSCPKKNFKEPESYGSKLNGIKYLFEKGVNIVSTHSLFSLFDDEIIELAYANNYTLVMDEVVDVIEPLPITRNDLDTIMEKFAHIEENHRLVWDYRNYKGKFDEYKRLCDLGCMGVYNNNVILWLFPVKTFEAFRTTYILTYLFQAQTQKYYYDYYGIEYKYWYVTKEDGNYKLTNEELVYSHIDYNNLIHICDNSKINQIGDPSSSLSKSWYERSVKNGLLQQLKYNCINYFCHIAKTKSQYNMWTCFKDYKKEVSGKGYTKGFLASNIRATNEYRHKTSVAYLVNKFFNPYVKNFFLSNGIQVDEDAFALSEMLQWIWRSAIREGKEINLYIPSKRMRNLLIDWINKNSI